MSQNDNTFTEEELIEFIRDVFTMSLSREQLVNPTKDVVITLYIRFLAEFGIENVGQPDLMSTSNMTNIERYESSITLVNVFKSTSHLMSCCAGINDMSLSDIIAPKRRRTNRILSVFVVIWTRLYNMQHHWTQVEKRCVDLPQKRQIIEQRIRELKQTIEQRSMFLSSNRNKSSLLMTELSELARVYEQNKKLSEVWDKQSKQVKTDILRHKEQISEIDVDISKLKEEMIEIDQKVIRSPERIQSETKEKEIELENKRNEKRKQEKQYMELMKAIDHLRETSKGLKPSLDTFTEAFRDIEKIRAQCDSTNEMKVSAKNKEKQGNELKIKLREHETSVQTLRKQLTTNEKQYQQRLKTAKQLNNGIKEDLEAKVANQSDAEKMSLEQRLKLEKKLDDMSEEHQQFIELSESYYNKHLSSLQTLQKQFDRIKHINKSEQ